MIALIPLLVAVVGLLIYVLASNLKVAEIGRILLGCGVLVTLWSLAGHVVKVF